MSLGTLGALNVLLSADTAQFSSAMEKAAYTAERNLAKIGISAKVNSAIITTALVAAATGFAVKMHSIIEQADEIGKMAQKIGTTTEELSKLKFAASQSGVNVEQLSVAFSKLNKNMVAGDTVFASLGINLKNNDGSLRSNVEVLKDIADKFSKTTDNATKSAMAIAFFGKAGAGLIPLLNEGRDGIDALGNQASIFTQKFVQSSTEFNDKIKRLGEGVNNVFINMASEVIPILNHIADALLNSSVNMNIFKEAGKGVASVLTALTTDGRLVWGVFNALGNAIGETAAVLDLIAKGQIKAAVAATDDWGKETSRQWNQMALDIQKDMDSLAGKSEDSAKRITTSLEDETKAIYKVSQMHLKATETSKTLNNAAKDLGLTFQSSFEDAIIEGKKFSDVLVGLAKDIERIILRTAVTTPLANAIAGGISSFFAPSYNLSTQTAGFGGGVKPYTPPTFSKHGNVFSNGNIQAFASGGVINGPMTWPMSGGKTGLAGEAGKEAILPLTRTPSGDLGVKTSGATKTVVNIYAPPGSTATQDTQQEGGMEKINIYIDEAVAGNVSKPGSKTQRALKNTFGIGQVLNKR